MMLHLNVPFGHTAAVDIFERALKSIRPAKLYSFNKKKGLQREEELCHALQDLVSPNKLRTNPFADPPDPEPEPEPVQPPPNSDSNEKEDSDYDIKINIHHKYQLYINSKIRKYVRLSQKPKPPKPPPRKAKKNNAAKQPKKKKPKPKPPQDPGLKRLRIIKWWHMKNAMITSPPKCRYIRIIVPKRGNDVNTPKATPPPKPKPKPIKIIVPNRNQKTLTIPQ